MRYFEERIRTIAAFKMNGYSPYMEHVFVSPTDPLPAPLDGITPAQLHELDGVRGALSRRADSGAANLRAHARHAAASSSYAAAAELPHGFLLSPNVAAVDASISRAS